MKHIYLTLIATAALYLAVPAQNNINRYEFWFDTNFEGRTSVGITPVANLHLVSDIATTGLGEGMHSFHIRFRDNSATYSQALSQFFLKIPATTVTNRNIIGYEYWYDNNYAGKVSQSVTPQNGVNVITGIPTPAMGEGMHSFHIRFRDDQGMWSGAVSQFYYKIPATTAANKNIISYEYWFDNNYAAKVDQSVTPQSGVNVITGIPSVSLGDGLHSFHIRFKDDQNLYSIALSQFFYKIPAATLSTNNIVAYEYWYDNNYTGRVSQTMPPQSNIQLLTDILAGSLPDGLHLFHIRFLDERKAWSSTLSQFFQKISATGITNNQLNAYRFWFDGKISTLQNFNISPPVNIAQINETILTPILSTGDHTINIQLKDLAGRWSCATADTFNVAFARGGAITGLFNYNNTASTPLDSVWAVLKLNGARIDSVRTTLAGSFAFEPKFNGTYTLYSSTNKPWQGVNGTDAIKIQRHFAGLEYLTTPVRLQSADVNLTNSINGTDATKLKRRFSGLDLSFTRGDWTFAKPTGGDTIFINGGDVIQDFQGLCVGDVNGSNVPAPGDNPNPGSVIITHNGLLEVSPGQEFILPVRISNPGLVSAISLVIPYPETLIEVLDIRTRVGSPAYTAMNGHIRLAWSDLQTLNLSAGDTLILIKLKATEQFTGNLQIELVATNESELADETGTAIPYTELFTQTIKTIDFTGTKDLNSILQQCTIYPNPASYVLNIELLTTQNASLNMEITDMLGRVRTIKSMGELMAGINTFHLSTSDLMNGVYTIKLGLNGENGKSNYLYKVVISR